MLKKAFQSSADQGFLLDVGVQLSCHEQESPFLIFTEESKTQPVLHGVAPGRPGSSEVGEQRLCCEWRGGVGWHRLCEKGGVFLFWLVKHSWLVVWNIIYFP